MENYNIRIGTRGSRLALIQTEMVIEALKRRYPELSCETVILRTLGDRVLDKPLQEIGGKGLFITEFEEAIQKGEIDLAVHSAKDMPASLPDGLDIPGVLKREDPRDVLITASTTVLEDIPVPVIGTSSRRRQAQAEALFGNADCRSLRGNVDTRLKKLAQREYDGIILAAAGIKRLGLAAEEAFAYRYLTVDEMVPAAGQGIIAIEGRKGSLADELVGGISDATARLELDMERLALELLAADCHDPVGVCSRIEAGKITLWIMKQQNGGIMKRMRSADLADGRKLVESMVREIREEFR